MGNSFLLYEKLKETARRHASKTAVEMETGGSCRSYTYAEFYAGARKVASWLRAQGARKGERAAIVLENCPEWGMIYFGIIAAGVVAVPVDHQSKEPEILAVVKDADVRFAFLSSSRPGQLKLPVSIVTISVGKPGERKEGVPFAEVCAKGSASECPAGTTPDDLASIIYTSGTVARPKGVMLTHRNFAANYESIDRMKMVMPDDVILSILPLHHAYPFMINLLVPLFSGAKIVYLSELKPEALLQCSRERGVTILTVVPQIIALFQKGIDQKLSAVTGIKKRLIDLLREQCWIIRRKTGKNPAAFVFRKIHGVFGARLRVIACGGARLDPALTEYFMRLGFMVLEGYGLTETSPVVTFNTQKQYKIGSVGKPLPGVEITVLNPDSAGTGEVAVRGGNVMKGYYKREDETREAFDGDWFLTGDQGHIDREGFLFLTGRIKEVIVLSSGKNIYPEEVEAHYGKSPYVKEMCVLDAPGGGGELRAIVVPDYGYLRQKGVITVYGSIRWEFENLSKELPPYQRVMGFEVVNEDLPRTRLGKLKRYEIREKYARSLLPHKKAGPEAALTDADQGLINSPAGRAVLEYLKGRMSRDVNVNEHLELDLGIDSLGRVEMVSDLSALCKQDLSADFLADVFTVKELIAKMRPFFDNTACTSLEKGMPREVNLGSLWPRVLSEAPSPELLKKIEINPSLFARVITHYTRCYFLFHLEFLFGFTVEGKDHLPAKGPYIICANHASFLDGPIIASSVDYRTNLNVYHLGYREVFEKGFLHAIAKAVRVIQIDPAGELLSALKISNFILKQGKILTLFPEGERSIDGQVKEFKKGAGILVAEAGVPVVPAYISGAFEAWPRTQKKPKHLPVKITFGKAVSADALKGSAVRGKDLYEGIAEALRQKVLQLRK
jgi:long-chain acyl-CoA synthetase